ncbi:hypothetical protein AgCh_000424 [Apium graveolens]
MERLIRAAEGPSLSREFDELLKALKTSLNDNHFTYKKALDKTINFLRVVMVNQDNFLQKRIVVNINDSGIDKCMQVSINYLISRRASELDIMINKVKVVTHEDTMLLTELKNAQVAAFPEAYLQPSKDEYYFQHLAEEIVRVWFVSLREVIIYFEDGSFTFLGCDFLDSLSPTEIKRMISLLNDKDTATRAWRSILAEWLITREETRKRNEAEFEERRRKYDEEIEMFIKRSEELKAKGMSRISKDGKFHV